MIHLSLDEAIWLSLGIRLGWKSLLVNTQDVIQRFAEENPDAVILEDENTKEVLEIERKELLTMQWDYGERLNIALNHADEFDWKYDDIPRGQFTASNHIRLQEFCGWLIQQDFEVHEQFKNIWHQEGTAQNIDFQANIVHQREHPRRKVWTDEQLKKLLDYSKSQSQQQLANHHEVSRQRIGALLKKAKEKFETPKRGTWCSSITGSETSKR